MSKIDRDEVMKAIEAGKKPENRISHVTLAMLMMAATRL